MEDNSQLSCPNCSQKVRVPSGKHLKFSCPNCNTEFEVDGRIKETAKKNKFTPLYTFLFAVLFWAAYSYFAKKYNYDPVNEFINGSNNKESSSVQEKNKDNFKDEKLKLLVDAVDVTNETTNDYAVQLASRFPGEYNIGQICQIYDYVVNNWKYVNDSHNNENFRSASRSIKNNLAGDCDDFAIVISALIESVGGSTRISLAYDNENKGHAFTEVFISDSQSDMQGIDDEIKKLYGIDQFTINYTIDEDGKCWLNLDWFSSPRIPGGEYFKYVSRTIYYPTANPPAYISETR